jgi:hypothetical protein
MCRRTVAGVFTVEIAGDADGAGAPLVLLPLDLSPGQWEPLIPVLAAPHCTITLGGALLGSVASLEERDRSGYMGLCADFSTRWRSRDALRAGYDRD